MERRAELVSDAKKIYKTIRSCKSIAQLVLATRMIKFLEKKHISKNKLILVTCMLRTESDMQMKKLYYADGQQH
jgi:hypothetical protein